MKQIHTTATTVRKLKQKARSLAKTSDIPLCNALDNVAREAGYDDFHHVTEMLAQWQQAEHRPADSNHFADMPHPGRAIFEWLETHYKDAFETERERKWRFFQPDEPVDWSEQHPPLMNRISQGLFEYLVAECSVTIGSRTVRIAQLVLNESGDLLSPLQRNYLQEVMSTPIRPFLVSSVTPGKAATLIDLINDDALPISVATKDLSQPPAKGACFGLRVLQPKSRPHLSGSIWPFHPSSAGKLFAKASRSNPKAAPGKPDSLSATIIKFFFQDTFGAPTIDIAHGATGEELLLTTCTYEVRDLRTLVTCLQREAEVEQMGELSFVRRAADGLKGAYMAATITVDSSQRTVELFTETASLAASQRGWFESAAGNAVRFLRSAQQTATDVARSTSNEEYEELLKKQHEQIPPDLGSEIFQTAVLKMYADWADKPVPMLDNRSPRDLCTTPQGKERVRGLLELFEANEREMAARMKRPCISYQFLWDQVGLTR